MRFEVTRTPRVPKATLLLGVSVVLVACGSNGGQAPATTPQSAATIASPSASPSASTQAAQPSGRAVIHVSGGLAIDASGPGATCAFFYPATKQGVTYHVSSQDIGGSGGSWSLTLTDDTADTSRLAINFNTDSGSWSWGARRGGTIHVDPQLHHADFDVTLVKVVGQQQAQLTGSIDCP